MTLNNVVNVKQLLAGTDYRVGYISDIEWFAKTEIFSRSLEVTEDKTWFDKGHAIS